ncbi:hypothetical protein Ae706Ps2_1480c [Pseudonocardia sp. Ae706_Ps2]|nr:hypothetical protein Ae706Ps2_1480c [Pseudonocardia sp. Ae706_Ps2]
MSGEIGAGLELDLRHVGFPFASVNEVFSVAGWQVVATRRGW